MKLIQVLVFITTISFSVCAENVPPSDPIRVSHWVSSGEDDEQYALSIWKNNNDYYLSYSFIFESGSRVNATPDIEDFPKLISLGNGCFIATVYDLIEAPEVSLETIICERSKKAYWALLSNEPISFVPNYVVLDEYPLK